MSFMQRRSTSDLHSISRKESSKPASSSSSSLPLPSSSFSKEKPYPPSAIPRPTTTTFTRSIRSNGNNRSVSAPYPQSSPSSSEISGVGLGGGLGFGGVARTPQPTPPSFTISHISPALRRSLSHSATQKLATPTGQRTPSGTRAPLTRRKKKAKGGVEDEESISDNTASSEELSEGETPTTAGRIMESEMDKGKAKAEKEVKFTLEQAQDVFRKAWEGFDPGQNGKIHNSDLIEFFRRIENLLPGGVKYAVLTVEGEELVADFVAESGIQYIDEETVQSIFEKLMGGKLMSKILTAGSSPVSAESSHEYDAIGSGTEGPISPPISPKKIRGKYDPLGRPSKPMFLSPGAKGTGSEIKNALERGDESSLFMASAGLNDMDALDLPSLNPIRSSTPVPEEADAPRKKQPVQLFDEGEMGAGDSSMDGSLFGLTGHSSLLGPMTEGQIGFVKDNGEPNAMSPVEVETLGTEEQNKERERLLKECEHHLRNRGETTLSPLDTIKVMQQFTLLYKDNYLRAKKFQELKKKMEADKKFYDTNRTILETKVDEVERMAEEYRKQLTDSQSKLRKAAENSKTENRRLLDSEEARQQLLDVKESLKTRLEEEKKRYAEALQRISAADTKMDEDKRLIEKLCSTASADQRTMERLRGLLAEAEMKYNEEFTAAHTFETETISLRQQLEGANARIFGLERDLEILGVVDGKRGSTYKREDETLSEFFKRRALELEASEDHEAKLRSTKAKPLDSELSGVAEGDWESLESSNFSIKDLGIPTRRDSTSDSQQPGDSEARSGGYRSNQGTSSSAAKKNFPGEERRGKDSLSSAGGPNSSGGDDRGHGAHRDDGEEPSLHDDDTNSEEEHDRKRRAVRSQNPSIRSSSTGSGSHRKAVPGSQESQGLRDSRASAGSRKLRESRAAPEPATPEQTGPQPTGPKPATEATGPRGSRSSRAESSGSSRSQGSRAGLGHAPEAGSSNTVSQEQAHEHGNESDSEEEIPHQTRSAKEPLSPLPPPIGPGVIPSSGHGSRKSLEINEAERPAATTKPTTNEPPQPEPRQSKPRKTEHPPFAEPPKTQAGPSTVRPPQSGQPATAPQTQSGSSIQKKPRVPSYNEYYNLGRPWKPWRPWEDDSRVQEWRQNTQVYGDEDEAGTSSASWGEKKGKGKGPAKPVPSISGSGNSNSSPPGGGGGPPGPPGGGGGSGGRPLRRRDDLWDPHEVYHETIETTWETYNRLTDLVAQERITIEDARFVADFVLTQSREGGGLIIAIWWLASRAERAARRTFREQLGSRPKRGERRALAPVHSPFGALAWPLKMIWDIIYSWQEELDEADTESMGSRPPMTSFTKRRIQAASSGAAPEDQRPVVVTPTPAAEGGAQEAEAGASATQGGTPAAQVEASAAQGAATGAASAEQERVLATQGLAPSNQHPMSLEDELLFNTVANPRRPLNRLMGAPRNLPAYILRAGPKPGHAWGILTMLLWILLTSLLAHNTWLYWTMKQDRWAWEELNTLRGFEGGAWGRVYGEAGEWRMWEIVFGWIGKWAGVDDLAVPS